ncbi:hypothetical protein Poly51_46380 [Rubripirellula tenax]|uniref:Uncharacterized protein n=1 Tax=Rubripirellula tenax TaxID=2528015 RepID=A0A5C6EJZ7_9BACT|nr:hypothetical protein Poly51_46380 [Rubripirellula tenax]
MQKNRQAAYDSAKPLQAQRQFEALDSLLCAGKNGRTRYELAVDTGILYQSIKSVALALLRDGLVEENGEVWVAYSHENLHRVVSRVCVATEI